MAILSPLLPALETSRGAQFDAPAPLRLWHLTSLDAPTVAVTWTLAFAWSARIRLPIWLPVVLGLAAWTFYIADRIFDARNARASLQARHRFHWQHRRIFVPVALAAAVAAIALVLYFMPLAARTRNSVLAAAALAYFTSVHGPWQPQLPKFSLRIPKELLVAIIFTLACTIPTLARTLALQLPLLISILVFIALAWLNCYAIESWESWESHSRPSQRLSILRLAMTLALIALLSASVLAAVQQHRQSALLVAAALSATLLALLDRHRQSLTPISLRCAADLVLLVPLALLAIP